MLMRRATAISLISFPSCLGLSPVISAKIHSSVCVAAQNSKKKSLKTHTVGVQSRSRSSMLVPRKAGQQCFMIRSKSVFICNCSCGRLDSSRNRSFWRGYLNLMHSYEGLLEPRRSSLTPLKSTFNAEHFLGYICCPGLSWMISAQFTVKMCITAWNREKFTKSPYFAVQSRSRSSMLVPPKSSSAVLVMIRSKSAQTAAPKLPH